MMAKKNVIGPRRIVPRWLEANAELWYEGQLIKRFRQRSVNQFAILRAFEALGWPVRVSDPILWVHGLVPKARLHDAIKLLNRGQNILRFGGDGTGEGVRWWPSKKKEK
jgi:hypothetical protein